VCGGVGRSEGAAKSTVTGKARGQAGARASGERAGVDCGSWSLCCCSVGGVGVGCVWVGWSCVCACVRVWCGCVCCGCECWMMDFLRTEFLRTAIADSDSVGCVVVVSRAGVLRHECGRVVVDTCRCGHVGVWVVCGCARVGVTRLFQDPTTNTSPGNPARYTSVDRNSIKREVVLAPLIPRCKKICSTNLNR
jgi:hypothetical protein